MTPARGRLIDIQKQSGMSRCRSVDKKNAALMKYLEQAGLSPDEYKQLEKDANCPWYRDCGGYIVLPQQHFLAALVQSCYTAPAGARLDRDNLRSLLKVTDFQTDRRDADGKFERFIPVKDGSGKSLSNQRQFRSDEFIANSVAIGTLEYDEGDIKPKSLEQLITYAGKYIGTGSCRKMGYGRFEVLKIDPKPK
jgi:hypothetical protein